MLTGLLGEKAATQDEGRNHEDRHESQQPMFCSKSESDSDTEKQVDELLWGLDGGSEPNDGECSYQP